MLGVIIAVADFLQCYGEISGRWPWVKWILFYLFFFVRLWVGGGVHPLGMVVSPDRHRMMAILFLSLSFSSVWMVVILQLVCHWCLLEGRVM